MARVLLRRNVLFCVTLPPTAPYRTFPELLRLTEPCVELKFNVAPELASLRYPAWWM